MSELINSKSLQEAVKCFEDKEFMEWFDEAEMSVVDIMIVYKGWLAHKQFLLTKAQKQLDLDTGEQVLCFREEDFEVKKVKNSLTLK